MCVFSEWWPINMNLAVMVFTLSPSQVTSAKQLRYYDKKVTVKKDFKDPKILLKLLMNSLIDTRLCCPDCNTDVHVGTGGTSNLNVHRNSKVCKDRQQARQLVQPHVVSHRLHGL